MMKVYLAVLVAVAVVACIVAGDPGATAARQKKDGRVEDWSAWAANPPEVVASIRHPERKRDRLCFMNFTIDSPSTLHLGDRRSRLSSRETGPIYSRVSTDQTTAVGANASISVTTSITAGRSAASA